MAVWEADKRASEERERALAQSVSTMVCASCCAVPTDGPNLLFSAMAFLGVVGAPYVPPRIAHHQPSNSFPIRGALRIWVLVCLHPTRLGHVLDQVEEHRRARGREDDLKRKLHQATTRLKELDAQAEVQAAKAAKRAEAVAWHKGLGAKAGSSRRGSTGSDGGGLLAAAAAAGVGDEAAVGPTSRRRGSVGGDSVASAVSVDPRDAEVAPERVSAGTSTRKLLRVLQRSFAASPTASLLHPWPHSSRPHF